MLSSLLKMLLDKVTGNIYGVKTLFCQCWEGHVSYSCIVSYPFFSTFRYLLIFAFICTNFSRRRRTKIFFFLMRNCSLMPQMLTVKSKAWCLKTLLTNFLLIVFMLCGIFLTPELHGHFKIQCFAYHTIYVKHT